MMWWQLLLEEYESKVQRIAGYPNLVADGLLRLEMEETEFDEQLIDGPRKKIGVWQWGKSNRGRPRCTFSTYIWKNMPDAKSPLTLNLLKLYQDQVKELGKQTKFSEQEKKQMTEKKLTVMTSFTTTVGFWNHWNQRAKYWNGFILS